MRKPSAGKDRPHALCGARLFDGERFHDGAAVVVTGAQVTSICPIAALSPEIPVQRLEGGILAPGFVDAQVNGGGGRMLNDDPSPETMLAIAAAHRKFGTTSLLPTLISDTPEKSARAIAAAITAAQLHASVAGVHLEGPHLAPSRKGAHQAEFLRPLNDDDIGSYVQARAACGTVLLTLAAEQATPDQVKRLAEAGVIVSLGHSNCTADQAEELFDAGATGVTHLFNAMSQLGHRAPGLVGAALCHPHVWCGIIADGHHVDRLALKIALRAKAEPGRLFFVTDAMSLVGEEGQSFLLNGREVRRQGGLGGACSRLTLPDGTLAGSDLDMASAIQFGVEKLDLPLAEALRMATSYPASFLKLADRGVLAPGSRADMVHMSGKLAIQQVWTGGVARTAGVDAPAGRR
ncbi:N-acetylglucosamine-6-phosphate deacetylase [Aureimonas fodinaquatilis]|uniref:N-acetylglucosamine-6-phosphate deacetylase n=1 Tax=Aureimonas fodinaquatilis TaxID=2565783 RepID=A0A5B0DUA1_9HYPH|nr:N-acetylglucosamine-6-phosphate deacetylase [Aureimonas fodinaquatilis]KAA0969351.1 N-acetylglucosamine-6-phosphate deacetylase [Aureimonas fodinaquatilis]